MGRLVSATEMAEIMGVSITAISNWTTQGCPFITKGGRGKQWTFDTAAVLQWREDQAALSKAPQIELNEARRRKLAAECALAELQLYREQSLVVGREQIETQITEEYAYIRKKIAAIPHKVAGCLMGCQTIAQAREILEREVRNCLIQLSTPSGLASSEPAH